MDLHEIGLATLAHTCFIFAHTAHTRPHLALLSSVLIVDLHEIAWPHLLTLGQTWLSVDTTSQGRLTQLLRQAGRAHVNLPRPQGLHEDVPENALVSEFTFPTIKPIF